MASVCFIRMPNSCIGTELSSNIGFKIIPLIMALLLCRPFSTSRLVMILQVHSSRNIGQVALSVKKPLLCEMVLFRTRSKGRKGQRSTITDCYHTAQWTYELTTKEPWALVTNLTMEAMPPQKLVNLFQKRINI